MRVAVIGAGLLGLCSAYYLQRGGAEVTVIDAHEEPGRGTSFANGALLHAGMVQPWNSPGVWRNLLRSVGRDDAATVLRLGAIPSLAGWGMRFLAESRTDRHRKHTLANLLLALRTRACMDSLRAEHGLRYEFQQRGLLTVCRDAVSLAAGEREAAALSERGLRHVVLDAPGAVSLEPALARVASELAGAVYYPDDEGGDAFLFCREMTRVCRELGVQFRFGESITPATLKGQCPWTVQLDSEALKVEAVLITAGADSQRLLAPLGVALPVRPVKGYSITVPRPLAVVAPTVPVADSDLHIAFVPIGAHRLRMVGTAEFAGHDLSLNERRLGYLRAQAERLYPEVLRAIPSDSFTPWTGLRPMSVDGVPLIGSTRIEGLFLCTGHGHLGWTLAAASGEHIALQMLGLPTTLDASAYAPTRFAALA